MWKLLSNQLQQKATTQKQTYFVVKRIYVNTFTHYMYKNKSRGEEQILGFQALKKPTSAIYTMHNVCRKVLSVWPSLLLDSYEKCTFLHTNLSKHNRHGSFFIVAELFGNSLEIIISLRQQNSDESINFVRFCVFFYTNFINLFSNFLYFCKKKEAPSFYWHMYCTFLNRYETSQMLSEILNRGHCNEITTAVFTIWCLRWKYW